MADSGSPNPPQSTRLAVLVFTDIVGSTDLKTRLGTSVYAPMLARHNEIFESHGRAFRDCQIVKHTGDGYFAIFETVTDAVRFALRFQQAMRSEPWGATPLTTRLGIHIGEVAVMNMAGQQDLVGLSADLTARLMALAVGGQILMSRSVFDQARQFVNESSAKWVAHGPYLFKGADEPMEVFEVGIEGISPLAAPPSSDKARRVVPHDQEETLGWRPAAGQPVPGRPGWLLEKELGEGGFGEVWLGRHFKTQAARVFKFCFDTDRLRSFKRELTLFRLLREALGERRDIARLFEVKLDEPPYYLESEFTTGGNLVDWTAAQGGPEKIPLDQRIEIVAVIADAVSAAHSVGILHKDIKPTNVLIQVESDGAIQPRLSDFGIGMLAHTGALESRNITPAGFTLVTEDASSRTGTRMYAPPELLAGKPFTTQGDIYSLGVLLYQLVVADLNRPLAEGWERDVPDPLLRQDIAACVEGDPSRRLSSASELATRLRSLDQRRAAAATLALDLAAADRRRRMLRLSVAGSAALAVLLALATVFFVRERSQKIEIARQKKLADDRFNDVRNLAKVFLFDLHHQIEDLPGATPAIELLVTTGQAYLAKLSATRSDDPELLADVAEGYQQIGNLLGNPRTKQSLGKLSEARANFDKAAAILDPLVKAHPGNARFALARARIHESQADVLGDTGDPRAALQQYTLALETYKRLYAQPDSKPELLHDLIAVHQRLAAICAQVDPPSAVTHARSAVEYAQTQLKIAPADAMAQLELVTGVSVFAQYAAREEAIRALRDARPVAEKLVREHPDNATFAGHLGNNMATLGTLLLDGGDVDGAMVEYTANIEIRKSLVANDPRNTRHLHDLVRAHDRIAEALYVRQDFKGAIGQYLTCRELLGKLLDIDPGNAVARNDLAITVQRLGASRAADNDLPGAIVDLRQAITIARQAIARDGGTAPQIALEASLHDALSGLIAKTGDHDGARSENLVAQDVASRGMKQFPGNYHLRRQYFIACFNLAGTLNDMAMQAQRPASERRALSQDSLNRLRQGRECILAMQSERILTPNDEALVQLFEQAQKEYEQTLAQFDSPATKPSTTAPSTSG